MNFLIWGKIYLSGAVILAGAIVVNAIAYYFSIPTWYDLFQLVPQKGLAEALGGLSPGSVLFLFLVYPFLLGLLAYFCFKFIL